MLLHLAPLMCFCLLHLSTMERSNIFLSFFTFPEKLANCRLKETALQDNSFSTKRKKLLCSSLVFQQWFCDASSKNYSFCDDLLYGLFLLMFVPDLGTKWKDAEEWVPSFWLLEHGHLYKGMWLLFGWRAGLCAEASKGDLLGWKVMAIVGGTYLV